MKSVRLISLAIAVLCCAVSFAQPDTIKRIGPPKPIHVRHLNSIDKKYQALILLDGKIIDEKELQNINSNNIESVTILKDSVSKKLFDGQARNGIIVIKTKKFSKRELRPEPKANGMERSGIKNEKERLVNMKLGVLMKKPCSNAHEQGFVLASC